MERLENYHRLEEIKEGVIEEISHAISRGILDADELQELADRRTDEEAERLCIYYVDAWAICSQANISDFYIEQLGQKADNITELAVWTLLDLFCEQYNTTELIENELKTIKN